MYFWGIQEVASVVCSSSEIVEYFISLMFFTGNYSTLEQEVQAKNKKLQKIYSKYEEVKQDIQDIMEEFNRDRRELEQSQDELLKDLKLRKLIIGKKVFQVYVKIGTDGNSRISA